MSTVTKITSKSTGHADIASLLISFTRSMYKAMRKSTSCSFLEMKTLTIAHEHKNPSMKVLADELGISSPAITAIVERLVKDGDLIRVEDTHDRRMTRISLTAKGKRTFEKSRAAIHESINARASALSAEERKELARILNKLQDEPKSDK